MASSNPLQLTACPVCETELQSPQNSNVVDDTYALACPRCGQYSATIEFCRHRAPELGQQERIALSGIIRRFVDAHGHLSEVLTQENFRQLIDAASVPSDVDGQIDHLLEAIAARAPYYGQQTERDLEIAWAARSFLPSKANLRALVTDLKEMGILKETHFILGGTQSRQICFALELKGWQRLHEVRNRQRTSGQVFVAMWFHDEMKPIYDDAIEPAITACGLDPYRIDRANHQNRIDDEIIAQIRRSRLLIADFTGDRGGVYYEAGFAQGLGIPVIWCCNRIWTVRLPIETAPNSTSPSKMKEVAWSDRLHFDTRQFPHILWTDAEDLKRQLINRIRALALDLPTARATGSVDQSWLRDEKTMQV